MAAFTFKSNLRTVLNKLDEGKDLVVNYRVWLQNNEMTIEQAQALSNDFVNPVKVTVK